MIKDLNNFDMLYFEKSTEILLFENHIKYVYYKTTMDKFFFNSFMTKFLESFILKCIELNVDY